MWSFAFDGKKIGFYDLRIGIPGEKAADLTYLSIADKMSLEFFKNSCWRKARWPQNPLEFWSKFQSKKQLTSPTYLFSWQDVIRISSRIQGENIWPPQNPLGIPIKIPVEKAADFINSFHLPTIKCSGVFPSLSLLYTLIRKSQLLTYLTYKWNSI